MIIMEAVRSFVYMLPPVFLFLLSISEDIELSAVLSYIWILVIPAVAFFALSTLRWYLYTYSYEEGYLHIKRGLVFKKERSLKKERVQTVNIRTGLLQRLLDVATVRIETAGGGMESEVILKAVKMEEAQRIRSYLESGPKSKSYTTDEESTKTTSGTGSEHDTEYGITASYVLPMREIFLAGATSGRFMLLFSFIAAAFSQFYPYIPEYITDLLIEQLIPESSTDILLVVIILLSLLILSWLVSVLAYMVKYANFTIHRQHEYLKISWGLIEQKEFTLKINRIQALSIQEGLFRQPFGLCAINSEVAGGGLRDQEYVTIICPLLHKRELATFLEQILPEYKIPASMTSVPRRARKRYLFRTVGIAIIIILPLQLLPYGWMALFLLLPAFILGLSRYRAGATSIDDKQLTFRFRNINRYIVLMMKNHIQSLESGSNPFQRRSDLSNISTSVLSSPSGKTFHVDNVDDREAKKIWKWFSGN